MSDEVPDQLSIDECQTEMMRIGKLFDAEQFDLNQLFVGRLVVMATQINSAVQLLIKKGILEQEEADLNYFNLLAERMQDWEKELLPHIREQRLRAQIIENGQVQQSMNEIKHLFGPDGKPLT